MFGRFSFIFIRLKIVNLPDGIFSFDINFKFQGQSRKINTHYVDDDSLIMNTAYIAISDKTVRHVFHLFIKGMILK